MRQGPLELCDDVMVWIDPSGEKHRAGFTVNEASPLFQPIEGSTFPIRYNPADPEGYYHRELSETKAVKFLALVIAVIGFIPLALFVIWQARQPK